MSLPEIEELQRLHLEPGDVLVLNLADGYLTQQNVHELKEAITERIHAAGVSEDVPVLIVSDGHRLEVQRAGERDTSTGPSPAGEGRVDAGGPVPVSPVNPAREVC